MGLDFIIAVVIGVFLLLFSVVVHECAHGWMAEKCGDPTARLLGRITLNPIKHIDPFFTIIMPAMLAFLHLPIFGGAKPVPVNFNNLRSPKRDMIWVAAAGPVSNLLLVLVTTSIFIFVSRLTAWAVIPLGLFSFIREILIVLIQINLILALFNLVPIPPLDGSRIVYGLLPYRYAINYAKLERFGIVIIFLLLWQGGLGWISPVIDFITRKILHTATLGL